MDSNNSTLSSVRPRRSLGRAWLAAAIVGSVPLFGALYWLASQGGDWRQVVVVQVVAIGFGALVWVRHSGAFAQVTDSTITKQSLLASRVIRREDVTSIVMAQTWRPGSSDSHREMLLKGSGGATLLRFDGTFWGPKSMDSLATSLGVPVIVDNTPVTVKEFLARHPGARYWYEGKPWLTIVGIVLAFGVAFLGMSWIMHAVGADSLLSI